MINLVHRAPRTLSEISVGTPAAASACAAAWLDSEGSITSSPRPWCLTWPGPAISVAT